MYKRQDDNRAKRSDGHEEVLVKQISAHRIFYRRPDGGKACQHIGCQQRGRGIHIFKQQSRHEEGDGHRHRPWKTRPAVAVPVVVSAAAAVLKHEAVPAAVPMPVVVVMVVPAPAVLMPVVVVMAVSYTHLTGRIPVQTRIS